MADPTFDPNRPYSYGHPQSTPAAPTFDPNRPSSYQGQQAPTSTDPFIKDLQTSHPAQLAAGVTQGFVLDPIEKAGELTGIGQNPPKWLEDRLQATREAAGTGVAGVGGHIAGQVMNPLFWFAPELKAPEITGALGSTVAKILSNMGYGAFGGATQPTGAKSPSEAAKATIPQAETGALVGGALGLPGAVAKGLGYDSLQQPLRKIVRALPLEFRRLEHLRDLGVGPFTRWWHGESLKPIGGRAPVTTGKAAMDEVGGQIGKALDDSTRDMNFDLTDPTVSRNLATQLGTSRLNLGIGGGNALNEFNRLIDSTVHQPLRFTGGKLSSDELQRISSNLEAHTRAIDPVTPDAALLKRELENYRMTILDNAGGTPAEKAAYAKAREAWRLHATGRDSQAPGEASGEIHPDRLAAEMDRRDPLRYPYGGGPRGRPSPHQRAVNQAQQAMIKMTGAARRGKAGRPLAQPGDYAGAAGAVTTDQPMRFTWPSQ